MSYVIPAHLQAFYNAIGAWIDQGMPAKNHYGFRKDNSLCINSFGYDIEHNTDIMSMMTIHFGKEKCESIGYPFNISYTYRGVPCAPHADIAAYCKECDEETVYENPKRLAWIDKHRNNKGA